MTSKPHLLELEEKLNQVSKGLALVTGKKMFGCHALWADGNVFALIWKHGRIGVKLPDEQLFGELMARSGAEPWKAGPMTMSHWVLVPHAFHSGGAELKGWVKRAHELASSASRPKAKVKKKPAKAKSK